MGKFSRDKGARSERNFVNRLKDRGIPAKRVPLSGAIPDQPGDIVMPWISGELVRFEAKVRAEGFKQIYGWIRPHKGLIIKADKKEPLVIVRMDDYAEMLNYAQAGYCALEQTNEAGEPLEKRAA